MLRWVGGIVAGVLTAVVSAILITHFTAKPVPPAQPPQITAQSITIEGRISNDSTNDVVPGANISIQSANISTRDTSDSEGRYLFIFPAAQPVVARLFVQAPGFQDFNLAVPLSADNSQELRLKPVTPPPPPPAGVHAAVLPPYVRRPVSKAIMVNKVPGR